MIFSFIYEDTVTFLIFTDKTLYLIKFYTNTSSIKSLDMIGLKIDYMCRCTRSIM